MSARLSCSITARQRVRLSRSRGVWRCCLSNEGSGSMGWPRVRFGHRCKWLLFQLKGLLLWDVRCPWIGLLSLVKLRLLMCSWLLRISLLISLAKSFIPMVRYT
ncbi:hypothetical protein LINPERPRIM_LOCUS42493 [Linum perenne]